MRRRDFITLIGAATTWPLALRAQQPERLRRGCVLLGGPQKDPANNTPLKAFWVGMRDEGWVEGRRLKIEYRYAGTDGHTIKKHVAELIRLEPDVILANSGPVMVSLQPATNRIPIVFVVVNDPVRQGFISNLAHPGGNVTGF